MLMALLLMAIVTSAQSYAIRVTVNTNLRATASLQANIVESVPADTQPQTVTNIDNCCFVDRQCASDQEWTDGYWAFQNNQCGVPAERSETLPSEPNRARVEGPPDLIRFIEDTLDLLEARSAGWYGYVIDHIDLIAPTQAYDPDDCGAYAYSKDRKITVHSDCPTFMTPYTANLIQMASIIVHEACHIYHHEQGITYPEGLPREEWECGKLAIEAMKALDARQQYFVGVTQIPFEELQRRNS